MTKHAVITGGGSGIGLAIATRLIEEGIAVSITGRNAARLDDAAAKIGANAIVMDVCDEGSVTSSMAKAVERFGKIDIVIANAGIAEGQNIQRSTLDFWRNIMSTNLDGAYLTIREGLRHMPINTWGRVIAISSIAGIKGLKGAHAYTASKHGVVGLIRALSEDHAKRPVTFNALCPGYVDTDIITRNIDTISSKTGISADQARDMMVSLNPHDRLIAPSEVAAAVAWLCGPGSDSVDGQAIPISGGPI